MPHHHANSFDSQFMGGDFFIPTSAACVPAQNCEFWTEIWLMWPSTISTWSLNIWQHNNSTAGIYTIDAPDGTSSTKCECLWANKSPYDLGLSNEQYCSLSYTKESTVLDAFSIWCPISTVHCRTQDTAVVKTFEAALALESVSDTLVRSWIIIVLRWGYGQG